MEYGGEWRVDILTGVMNMMTRVKTLKIATSVHRREKWQLDCTPKEETSTSAQITCVTIACKRKSAEAAEELNNDPAIEANRPECELKNMALFFYKNVVSN
jgi:hypothetical protein